MIRRNVLVVVSLLGAAILAASTQAARSTPGPGDTLTFTLQPVSVMALTTQFGRSTADCPALVKFRVRDGSGKNQGMGTGCFTSLGTPAPHLEAFLLDLSLQLRGGSIEAVAGTSFLGSGPPFFSGQDSCLQFEATAGQPDLQSTDCSAAITAADGVFTGLTGWVTYIASYVPAGLGGPSMTGSLTIAFS
jgi:hypothetical protein